MTTIRLLAIAATALFASSLPATAQEVSAKKPKVTTRPPLATQQRAPTAFFQPCSTVEPDASYLIPRSNEFSGQVLASGDGEYGYQSSADCPYWVTDFKLNRYSNTWISESGALMKEGVLFKGDAYDLPSSQSHGGTRPIVEEDCRRLEVDVILYRREPGTTTFKLVDSGKGRFASWSESGGCSLSGLPEIIGAEAPNANILTIRIATRARLRDSWQQAAGTAFLAPPN